MAPSQASCSSPSGEWGEEVWGAHSSQSHRSRPVGSVRQTTATSAGECRQMSWATTARPTASRSGPVPHTPSAPSSRRLTMMGTSLIVA